MPIPQPAGSVLLAEQRSASGVLHGVIADAATAFSDALREVVVPADPRVFRSVYPELLPRFEAARLASDARHEIARHAVSALQRHIVWQDGSGSRPLQAALTEEATPLPLEVHAFDGEPGWRPTIEYGGARWEGIRLADLAAEQVRRGIVTPEAGDALAWLCDETINQGTLDLSSRKIAVLGGGAEMAPTQFWLEAGADVCWLDVNAPPVAWLKSSRMTGRLFWPRDNVDLLTQPREVLATLVAFSDGDPLDVGLYAYAPGNARELRLTATMNALVNALPRDLIASVTMLVSPTTPTALSARDLAAMQARLEARPGWEAALARIGLLGRGGGCCFVGSAATTRTVVAIQGASYQAAQYLGKILTAECWATDGVSGASPTQPLRVSANTAAITQTRSLDHPVFAAAFSGAGALGVETSTPSQSSQINGLLAVRDWLYPELPVPGSVRVHGGLHTLPYPLEKALRVAAAIGFARSPALLGGLIRGRRADPVLR